MTTKPPNIWKGFKNTVLKLLYNKVLDGNGTYEALPGSRMGLMRSDTGNRGSGLLTNGSPFT